MTISNFVRLGCAVVMVGFIIAQRTSVQAQQRGGTAETAALSKGAKHMLGAGPKFD